MIKKKDDSVKRHNKVFTNAEKHLEEQPIDITTAAQNVMNSERTYTRCFRVVSADAMEQLKRAIAQNGSQKAG